MKSWTTNISTALLLVFCLSPINALTIPDQQAVSKPLPVPPTTQSAEVVYARGCHITIEPAENFALHVPLKDNGDMDTSKLYITGDINFHVDPDSCGIVNIIHK